MSTSWFFMLSSLSVDNADNFADNLQIYEMQVYIGVDNSVDKADYIIFSHFRVTFCNLAVTFHPFYAWIVIFVTNYKHAIQLTSASFSGKFAPVLGLYRFIH